MASIHAAIVIRARSIFLTALICALSLASGAATSKVIIGVAHPYLSNSQDPNVATLGDTLRQNLMSQLQSANVEVAALDGDNGQSLSAEAKAKNCTYVLQTRIERKPNTHGIMGKLSFVTSMAHSSNLSPTSGTIKTGETLLLEYRLLAGTQDPVKSETLQAIAKTDGENLLAPLVQQVTSAVTNVVNGQTVANSPSSEIHNGSDSTKGEKSLLGGIFHHHATVQTPSSNSSAAPDCAQIASMPNSPITREACEKMASAQRTYDAAQYDPSASRPGDDNMSCDQILAELKQQSYQVPDKAKVAEMQATVKTEQTTVLKQQAEVNAIIVKQTAEIQAAANVDRAAEAATMGVVRPNTAGKLAEEFQKENKVTGERMAKERKPTETKMINQTSDMASDMAQQLNANPRMAKLMQLAQARKCKGG
jgi:hypothetical protein